MCFPGNILPDNDITDKARSGAIFEHRFFARFVDRPENPAKYIPREKKKAAQSGFFVICELLRG